MLTQYTYLKERHQFGKQCVFTDICNVAEEDILPEPELMQNYVMRAQCHRGVQVSSQYAAHEVQMSRKAVTNTGVFHSEGGWPKEVNPRDSEVVQRFRRRVEKDDRWSLSMKPLLEIMEQHVLQNNTMDIYQNFFDDLIPTSMVREYSIRVTNLYEDPEAKTRPIRYLSWSPNSLDRLAAAYGFLEFQEHPVDVSPYSYVWDIENPNKAINTLKSSIPLMTIEFNARDPTLLVSGLLSGQVCCWDMRTSDKPVQTSHLYVSHRHPAIQVLWVPTKSNTDFFSSSTDGTVKWWDMRFLKKPTEVLVMDLDNPGRADILKAVGVTALQYEPTMSSKFLAGTENGTVVSVNRRTNNPVEKLAIKFECYTGPVIVIDRNPIYAKNFLTIGDWSAKIWADDTKEGCFLSTEHDDNEIDLTGGCWSNSRCSVFFTINTEGILEAYDVLASVKAPLTAIRVCRDGLTAIKSHEGGEYLAVGSRNGNVYLLECSDDFELFTKEDRVALSNYLERCSRYEKAIDTRLKEIRLVHGPVLDSRVTVKRDSKGRSKKREHKEKRKEKHSNMDKEKANTHKKARPTRLKGGKSTIKTSYPELINAETEYFLKVDEEAKKYTELDPADVEAVQTLLRERGVPKPEEEEPETEKEDLKRRRSIRKIKSRKRIIKTPRKSSDVIEEEQVDDTDLDWTRTTDKKLRARKILKKSCAKVVCKPEICCMDMEEKRKAKRSRELQKKSRMPEETPVRSRSFIVDNKWFRRLTDYIVEIPQPPRAFRRKILALKDTPPNILRKELEQAKKEIRVWQERAIARTLSSWAVEKRLEDAGPSVKKIDKEIETAKPEEPEKYISLKKDESKRVVKDVTLVKERRPRKVKKVKLTQEDIERQKEERQRELWAKLKKKVKQYDEQQLQKQQEFYPRISAALVKSSSDDMIDEDEERM